LDFGDSPSISEATRNCVYSSATKFSEPKTTNPFQAWFTKKTYSPYATLDELVLQKAPIDVILARGFKCENLPLCGITLDRWFALGYTLDNLKELCVSWQDMVNMRISPQHLTKIPASFFVDVLHVDISHLLHIGVTWQDMSNCAKQYGYKATDFLALKCTKNVLINMGWEEEFADYFPFTENQWKSLNIHFDS
jgi:hypothetical protein